MNVNPIKDNDKKLISGTFEDSTPLLGNPEELRRRAQEDGYLFFRRMLDPEEVMGVRKDMIAVLDRHGLIDRRHPELDAMADMENVCRNSPEHFVVGSVPAPIYRDIQKLQSFHALAQMPKLMAMYETLFGCEPFAHPRNIARIAVPRPELRATPSHQDFTYIQGLENTWTCWLPLGDTPRQLGGLAVLKGSHKAGLLDMFHGPKYGKTESILCGLDYDWLTTDYEVGDVLTFHSLTVHKALPNGIAGKIRFSCDYRYQPVRESIQLAEGSLEPHMARSFSYSWTDLYEGWTNVDLKYYWEKYNFELIPFKTSLFDGKEKIC